MKKTLSLILLLLVFLLAATPFSIMEQVINGVIDLFNMLLSVIAGGINVIGQLLGGIAEMLFNALGALIYNGLATVINTIAGTSYTWESIPFYIPVFHVSIPNFRWPTYIDDTFSPVGMLMQTIFGDTTVANSVGMLGIIALAIVVIIAYIKMRK